MSRHANVEKRHTVSENWSSSHKVANVEEEASRRCDRPPTCKTAIRWRRNLNRGMSDVLVSNVIQQRVVVNIRLVDSKEGIVPKRRIIIRYQNGELGIRCPKPKDVHSHRSCGIRSVGHPPIGVIPNEAGINPLTVLSKKLQRAGHERRAWNQSSL